MLDEKIQDWKKQPAEKKRSIIMFNIQFPRLENEPSKDELVIYDIDDAGGSTFKEQFNIDDGKNKGIFTNLFIPFAPDIVAAMDKYFENSFMSPGVAEKFVQNTIKKIIDSKDAVFINLDEDGLLPEEER
jgi:hypothetical protein